MKNIHILPTDEPSNLLLCIKDYTEHENTPAEHSDKVGNFVIGIGKYANTEFYQFNHIYITYDEEIKEDYVIAYCVVIKVMMFDKDTLFFINGTKVKRNDCKKIILTTDPKLIADGVQPIFGDFLKWFVKNPSCDEVKVESFEVEDYIGGSGHTAYPTFHNEYKIIIPKEKLYRLEYNNGTGIIGTEMSLKEEPKQLTDLEIAIKLEEIGKQETFVDVAERLVKSHPDFEVEGMSEYQNGRFNGIIEGIRYQQERSYSDEEIRKFMKKNEIEELILKDRYKTLSLLEDELPRFTKSKIYIKIDKMMGETLRKLASIDEQKNVKGK